MKNTTDTAPAENTNTEVVKENTTTIAKAQMTYSERFTNMVMKEFASNAGEVELTNFQRKLCQNYFIKIDAILKDSEIKRMAKAESDREIVAYTWENVNMQKLAVDVISFSAVGLDPCQPNHINPIPYKNKHTGKYDITFIMGYKGIEIKATKYGFDVPDQVIIELVYSTDVFKQFKKDMNNKVENYQLEVTNDFQRGEIVGGFYYHMFSNNPEKNKLRVFSIADIEKRKPAYAATEFWGGEKDEWVWDNVKKKSVKSGKKVPVDGWKEEMCLKTIHRAAYNAITIDSQKIDDNYVKVINSQSENVDQKVLAEINENANKEQIGFDDHVDVTGDLLAIEKNLEPVTEAEMSQQSISDNGPGY